MNNLRFDERGLARNETDAIIVYRRLATPILEDDGALQHNAIHTTSARTLFHGINGVYGGNTPESVAMLKQTLPYLMRFELPAEAVVDDRRHISNARWAGRHALALVCHTPPDPIAELTLVRLTPPVSLMSHHYRHAEGNNSIAPVWVITPPELFVNAPKEIIDE